MIIEGSGKSWFQLWKEGAAELEKTAPGKLITAPVQIPAAVVEAARKILEATGKTAETLPGTAKTIPIILIILAGGVAAYLVFAGKKGTKLI
jgi:hypothetical protein